ncbi:hypothetical protein KJ966_06165 [bacterium]|nr:hypothetical protein [bacterium]
MEIFNPPNFSDDSAETGVSAEILDSYDSFAGPADQAESFVPNILEEKTYGKKKKVDYSDFNSAEFNEVDTLLTNVEEYSRRIREDVDKYARNVRNETDLFRSETEMELANALIKRIEAEKQAAEIIQNAENTRDEILNQGREEGYQAGFAEGLAKQKEENETNTGAVLNLLNELQTLRKSMMRKNEEQIARLSMLIAQKVVHKKLTTEKELILEMLKSAMQHFEGMGNIKIKLHPIEFDFIAANQNELKKYLDEDQVINVRADQKINPGAPLIESDFTVVDLDLNKQFKEIKNKIDECVEDRRILFT